ncbi:MAG: phage integrase SAM-like domain-containing protein [Mameliella sp.]|nr:phage integrase SAM-like domain-containing protein [Phaeodactylibacter sp.]
MQRKDGKYPIVLQVTWDRKVRRKRLGVFAHEHQFTVFKDKRRKKEKVELSNMNNVQEYQSHIDDELQRAKDIYKEHFQDKEFNYNRFVEIFDKGVEEESELAGMTVAKFCNLVADEFESNGQAKSADYYRYTGVAVLKVSPNDIVFDEFDEYWLKQFVKKSRERGIKCYNYLVHLRSIFNKAVEEQIVDYHMNPFKNPYTNPRGFDISKYKKSKISKTNGNKIKDLTKEQLTQLKNWTDMTEKQRKYLAIWWFSFYCFGVNLIDVAKLKYKHIKKGRWYYDRSKTGVSLKNGKPLLKEALEIIEKFGTGGSGDDYVFDILVGYDKDEKTIADRVLRYATYIRNASFYLCRKMRWDGYFTYYSARYSSATLALNEGADRNTVSHLLDHENFSTIDNYAGRADARKVLEAMEILRLN